MTTPAAPLWTLSGFGDEIDPDPIVHLAVLEALGVHHLELRSAWRTNVVELVDEQIDLLSTLLAERSMGVSAIASPVGKVDVAGSIEAELARLDRAIAAAQRLGTRYIRVFSFFRTEAQTPAGIRDAVLHSLRAFADRAERAEVVLLHENETGVYGDTPERVVDLIESVGSPALRATWDSANYVQAGVHPFTEAYPLVRPYLDYVQIKDARADTGEVTIAGAGDGQIAETLAALREDGYTGYLSVEPHLSDASAYGGFGGPTAFGEAVRALTRLVAEAGVDAR